MRAPLIASFHSRRLSRVLLRLSLVIPAMSCGMISGGDDSIQYTFEKRFLEPGRRYAVGIPDNYSGEESVPLVLALHYGGEVTPYIGMNSLYGIFEPGLRKTGAIMVAPDCTGQGWTDPQSVEDVLEIMDLVKEEFNIDSERMIVTGYSMGAIGSWYFAANYPDMFSAAVPVSGYPPGGVLDGEWTVPIYAIHSRGDRVIPVGPTTEAVEELQERGVLAKLVVLDDIDHYNMQQFVGPLKRAVPWVEKLW